MITSWFGSGRRSSTAKPSRGGCLKTRRTSVWVTGRRLPVRMRNGTPDQRQLSISRRSAQYVSVSESGRDALDVAVAAVLAAHVARRIGLPGRHEDGLHRVLDGLGVATGGRLHRGGADDLHEVVDDDVAQRADGVVEVAAALDAEVLGQGDLHALDVVPVPDRLQHRVGEAQVEDLLEPHLPEVVVDPVELGLVHVAVELLRESPRRVAIVAERLLHHDPRGAGQPGLRQSPDDGREQGRRGLEVEHGRRGVPDGLPDARIGRGVGEIAVHVGEPGREPLEDRRVELLAGADDRLPGALDEPVERPVVERDADDRERQQPALLEPVQGPERHHPRQVAGDPEDHQDITVGTLWVGHRRLLSGGRPAAHMQRAAGAMGWARFSPAGPPSPPASRR